MNPYITPEFIQGINSGLMSGVENFTRAYTAGQDRKQRAALAEQERAYRLTRDTLEDEQRAKEYALRERGVVAQETGAAESRAAREREAALREKEFALREQEAKDKATWAARDFAAKNPYLAGEPDVRGPDIMEPAAPRVRNIDILPVGADTEVAPAPTPEFMPEPTSRPGPIIKPGREAAPFIPQDMVPNLRAYNAQQQQLEQEKLAAKAKGAAGTGQQLRDRDREWALRVLATPNAEYQAPQAYQMAQRILQEAGDMPGASGAPGAAPAANPLDSILLRTFGRQAQPTTE